MEATKNTPRISWQCPFCSQFYDQGNPPLDCPHCHHRVWEWVMKVSGMEAPYDSRIMTQFEIELAALINRHSLEGESNTPDFILAQYLAACLQVFHLCIQRREAWYSQDGMPASAKTLPPHGV